MASPRVHPHPPTKGPPPRERRRRAMRALKTVPILPSLVTLGNVFFGFLAMAKAADAVMLSTENVARAGRSSIEAMLTAEVLLKLEVAAILIFVAMLFDALDGAVARLTRQTSAFGAQLDSMADMVTFGVAPAFCAKVVLDLHTLGANPALDLHAKVIYVAAVVYVLCAAMRLARFNAEIPSDAVDDHQEFAGLPSPAGAAVIASLLLFFASVHPAAPKQSAFLAWLADHDFSLWVVRVLPVCLVVTGLLMVSRIPYTHVAVKLLRGGHSFPFLASLVVGMLLIALEHQIGLLAIVAVYLVSGMIIALYRLVTIGRIEPPIDALAVDAVDEAGEAVGFEAGEEGGPGGRNAAHEDRG